MNANYLLNAVATGDKEEVKSAFETLIQDRVTDALEVRKVELASTIFGVQEEEINEGEGMDAQRRWTRHVSAIGKGYENTDKGHKVSVHRNELKTAARKYFQRYGGVKGHGTDYVERGASFVKSARMKVKGPKLTDEETIIEGGPTRKHFQQTADLIKQIEHPEKRKEMAAHHASLFAQQNPRFDKKKFYAAAGVNEETVSEVIEAGAPSPRNVITNIRRGIAALRIKGVNPAIASRAHADYSKLVSKNPKAPGYMLLRKLAPNKAAAMQALTQAGLPVGGALDANPTEYNQALQRVKRFK